MLRTLDAQARAIWPQEQELFARYTLADSAEILDVGCGPGEISERLLEHFPGAKLLGLDLDPAHLERARARCARFGTRAMFATGDAVDLAVESARFDLTVCRHLLQAVPRTRDVLAELVRVTRAGGRLHLVAEDYAMMHFWPTAEDMDAFWQKGPITFAQRTGTDLRSGRKIYTLLRSLGVRDVRVDYVTVDTVRVDRGTFASIWEAWRDGYANAIAEHTGLDRAYVEECFHQMIACIRDPDGYAVWQLPVISAVIP